MKVILVLCVVILFHQKISLANYLRIDNPGKSSLSTEYQARFHQSHCDGANVSEGNIAGNHHFEKSTDEEPWESFAAKCASIIHSLVSALTSAVAPAPGDAMNLELDIKNHIFHHDDRQFNSCKTVDALPDCGNVPSGLSNPPLIDYEDQTLPYPSDFGVYPPLDPGTATLSPDVIYDTNPEQSPLSQFSDKSAMGYYPIDTSPAPDPTMNTPATQESCCETTTPNFASLPEFQNPLYDNGPGMDTQNNLIDGRQPFPSNALPLDNWKPHPNRQTDLISPGSPLTGDCSTSPHLAQGLATPTSCTPGNPPPNTYSWKQFYDDNPELLSPHSLSDSGSFSKENPDWASGFNWDSYPNDLPPTSFDDGSSNAVPGNGLATPVSPVTDYPSEDIFHGQQLSYLAPAEDKDGFSNIIPGDNIGGPTTPVNNALPGNTFTNERPMFVPPFESTNDLPNKIPGDGFNTPTGFRGLPMKDVYPNDKDGFLPPVSGYNDGDMFDQNVDTPSPDLANPFPQHPEYLTPPPPPGPPVPPPSFNDVTSDIIPSDSLVTAPTPITDYPFEDSYGNPQQRHIPPQSFNGDPSITIPNQNLDQPIESGPLGSDNWGPYPNGQPGLLPPQPFNDDSSNPNLDVPPQSGPFGNDNWSPYPNEQPELPPQSFGYDASKSLPNQNFGEPTEPEPFGNNWGPYPSEQPQPGSLPPQSPSDDSCNCDQDQALDESTESPPLGSNNWSPYPNEQPQPGSLPPQSFGFDASKSIANQNFDDPALSGPFGSDSWSPYPNEQPQPGHLPPQSFNDDSINSLPDQNLDGPLQTNPLGNENWYPNQQPGLVPPQSFGGDASNTIPNQNFDNPTLSGPLGNNWSPNPDGQPNLLPPQSFNDNAPNALPNQNLDDPALSGPFGNNWSPYPNEQPQPEPLPPQSPSDDSCDCDQDQALDESTESPPLGSNNWSPYPNEQLQPGSLPPQSFGFDASKSIANQNLDDPALSGPLGNNWGPYPDGQPGLVPPPSFNEVPSNALASENLVAPTQSGPFGNNWSPNEQPQPGSLPPQSFGFDASKSIANQNLDDPALSGPLENNCSPNEQPQPGLVPPQSFSDNSPNGLPSQNLEDPLESNPLGNKDWYPYPNQQLGGLPPVDGPSNVLPGQNMPTPTSSELDNSLDGTSLDASPQNQPDYLNGMNSPSNFIPSDNLVTPISPAMSDFDTNPDNSQFPFPSKSAGLGPQGSNSSNQPNPQDLVTEPPYNQECTPEYTDAIPDNKSHGRHPTDSNRGYDQFGNKLSGIYPPGVGNTLEEPPTSPGLFEPSGFESINQLSQAYPDGSEQSRGPGFPGQLGQYPADNGLVRGRPPLNSPYDDLYYNKPLNYQRPGEYAPGQNAAPNGFLQKPNQMYQNGLSQGRPKYYNPYENHPEYPEYGPASGINPSAIYIPVDPAQGMMLPDPSLDQDSDESCACDDCYYDDIVDQKAFRKTACRDLEEARDELKAIFDKIKKKLKCTQRNKCLGNM